MFKHRSLLLAVSLFASSISSTVLAEASDGVIVISDNEYPYGVRCDTNRVTQETWCNGSNCDNMLFQCAALPSPLYLEGVTAYIAHVDDEEYDYGWTSDEQGEDSENALCPPGYAMTGMYSTGDWSDNVRAICHPIHFPAGTTYVEHARDYWITNGAGGVTDYRYSPARQHVFYKGTNTWLRGASCIFGYGYCRYMYYRWGELL